jgi:hypothetical protein
MDERTADDWAEIIAGLERDRAAALENQTKAEAEGAGLALEASLGDAKAGAQMAKLDAAQDRARRIVTRLTRALEDAGRERAAVVAAGMEAQRLANLERARAIACSATRRMAGQRQQGCPVAGMWMMG